MIKVQIYLFEILILDLRIYLYFPLKTHESVTNNISLSRNVFLFVFACLVVEQLSSESLVFTYKKTVQRKGAVPRFCPHLSAGEVAAAFLRIGHQVHAFPWLHIAYENHRGRSVRPTLNTPVGRLDLAVYPAKTILLWKCLPSSSEAGCAGDRS